MVRLRNIEILGAGPAGLYASILLKTLVPSAQIRVTEQNPDDATFGFGVVFSDQALDFLRVDDPHCHALIAPHMERWRSMDLSLAGERVTLDGIGFAAIGRLRLLQILQQRAAELGVTTRFGYELTAIEEIETGADLVVGADGVNSLLRRSYADQFSPRLEYFDNHFAWFGTARAFDTLTQTFIRSPQGALNAHHYRYSPNMSTFIVECDHDSFVAHGFAEMDEQASADACARLFADTLEAAPLLLNHSHWRRFPRLSCTNWVFGRRVILGDAAHSAHFSIGSGTRLAFEDAIALVGALRESDDLATALQRFQQQRQPIVHKIVEAASRSARWYENFSSHMDLPAMQFGYEYLARSGRMDLDRLRLISPQFVGRYEEFKKDQ